MPRYSDNLTPSDRAEIEQAAITEYSVGNIGPLQFESRLQRAGLTSHEIQTALRVYRPKYFHPMAK